MSIGKTKVSITPIDALTPFALQILLDSHLTLDDCNVVVETIRSVKTNLYTFRTDQIADDLMTRLWDLIDSFKGRRGNMKDAFVALASLTGAQQMEAIATALVNALNSKQFRKSKIKERGRIKAALSDANREVLDKTQYSNFRPLRNKGTVDEHRPRIAMNLINRGRHAN